MNPKKWLYLSNLIEMLRDQQVPDEDPKITLEEIADMMIDDDESDGESDELGKGSEETRLLEVEESRMLDEGGR